MAGDVAGPPHSRDASAAFLLAGVAPEVGSARLLGWVRNVVDAPEPGYPWPTPEAYFAVWHCEVAPDSDPEGEWLQAEEAEAQLGQRHWWRLAAHVGVR